MVSLLILTQPIQWIIPSLTKVLRAASIHVRDELFIHLDNQSMNKTPKEFNSLLHRSHIISSIYSMSPSVCPGVEIYILMSGFKQRDCPINTNIKFDKVFIDYISKPSEFMALEKKYLGVLSNENSFVLFSKELDMANIENKCIDIIHNGDDRSYDDVVAGGTFDRLHPGHKILLSEAVLRCQKRLTVGIADGPLLKRKVLKELILPCSKRIELLRNFLINIDPSLKYNLVEIEEPMGPTSYDPDMEMIVVSDETKKGVPLINNYRRDHGLKELKSYCIKLFEDLHKGYEDEEDKYSSSSQRMRLLGTRLKQVTVNNSIPKSPYIIGLTGGSASGKTSIGAKLTVLGAGVIDCDKLGHKAYEYGSRCYSLLISKFGQGIINEDKSINRKILGSIVFNDSAKLKQLTDIVWPQIASLAKDEIENYKNEGKKVIILDAALLLEANWNSFCHEIWISIIDRDEAISRIVKRDGVSPEDAEKRIDSQMSNQERVNRADIMFSTLWSYDYTQQQVDKAWKLLENEGKV